MESEVDFARISRAKQPITLAEWKHIIECHKELEPLPDREGVNPFNGEKIVFAGEGKALYNNNDTLAGNASLEEGEILTTGIPIAFCRLIANELGASVRGDDRS